ncbi:hypothetical protein PAP_02810 [Palaeococcus pacificus DY20341]|uniref:Alpha-galactosidase NEW3 domain-containing protein n=1 Tax=Palaeococcus pacificus DY20341 TaxID=1343739 RepID=A0A075LWQ8_9EURY|nr:NEW3 domain-containing protein [Palaeococcus pacificus]AIF68983.1 hypothetical protein PAP_02810 [Palaeococcus pacificus DY20341]
MKKAVFALIVLLLASTIPFSTSQPWVEVFEGKVKIGETLIVGGYQIKITQGYTNNSQVPETYAIIYKGEQIKEVAKLGFNPIEVENVRIIPGSFNDETQEIFIVLQYKPSLVKEITPKEGVSFSVNDYSIEVIASSNESVSLSINGNEISIGNNSSRVYDRLAFEYNEGILKVYSADVQVKREEMRDYEIYYPFGSLKVEAGDKVQIPITVINNGVEDITLGLRIISKPLGWSAKLLEAGSNYEISEISLKAKTSTNLILLIEIPEDAEGLNIIRFAVGDEVGEVKLDVAGKEGLEVKTPILALETEAGQAVSFPIQFINYGDEKIVELEITEKPSDWNAYFTLNNQRIKSFLLDKSEQVNLIVEPPRNAELGEHEIKFLVNGVEHSVSVYIYKTHKGEKATLKISVLDDESKPIASAEVLIGNEKYLTDAQGTLEVELNPGDYMVEVKKEGFISHKEEISLSDGEEKSLIIRLTRVSYYFTAEIESDHLTVQFEYQIPYAVTLVNLGKLEDTYSLELKGLPSDWAYMFLKDTQSNIQVQSIKLDSEESRTVYLKIIPSYNAEPGTYNATLIITSSSGIKYERRLEIELVGSYELSVSLTSYQLSIKAGDESSTTMLLNNYGSAPITNINIEAEAPEGWEVEVVPSKIAKLESNRKGLVGGGSNEVLLRIKVPETTPAGEYRVTIRVKSDQAEWEDSLRVRVRQSSSSTYIGILILIAAFGGLILMMRRIGRR